MNMKNFKDCNLVKLVIAWNLNLYEAELQQNSSCLIYAFQIKNEQI